MCEGCKHLLDGCFCLLYGNFPNQTLSCGSYEEEEDEI